METTGKREIKASLFVTCLVDQFRPTVGEAMVKVLRSQDVRLTFPKEQTCCGQPVFNSGYRREALKIAEQFIEVFEGDGYIVTPSGSCAAMVKNHYQDLFADDPAMLERSRKVGERVYEFSQFLVEVLGMENAGISFYGKVAYHHSCHLLRELGVGEQPLKLLKSTRGLEYVEMENADQCCGFGGSFSVRYPEISRTLVDDKIDNIKKAGADSVVVNDTGCIMNISGRLGRRGEKIKVLHLAELLAASK